MYTSKYLVEVFPINFRNAGVDDQVPCCAFIHHFSPWKMNWRNFIKCSISLQVKNNISMHLSSLLNTYTRDTPTFTGQWSRHLQILHYFSRRTRPLRFANDTQQLPKPLSYLPQNYGRMELAKNQTSAGAIDVRSGFAESLPYSRTDWFASTYRGHNGLQYTAIRKSSWFIPYQDLPVELFCSWQFCPKVVIMLSSNLQWAPLELLTDTWIPSWHCFHWAASFNSSPPSSPLSIVCETP